MPFAGVLYACDGAWWKHRNGVPEFAGLKISQDAVAFREFGVAKVRLIKGKDELLVTKPGEIGDGGNSGFQALNLAVQFGATKIVLVGFDMRLDRGAHWHGRHGSGLNNPRDPNLMRWRRTIDGAAARLASLGVRVINASPVSTLRAYPIMSLEQALAC